MSETISKSEQKRREKQKKKEEEKKKKEEERKKKEEEQKKNNNNNNNKKKDEEDIDPTAYYGNRLRSLNKFNPNSYPHKFHADTNIPAFREKFSHLAKDSTDKTVTVSLTGRIMERRPGGAGLTFYDLKSDGQQIQVLASKDVYEDKQKYDQLIDVLRRGDIVGVRGHPARAKSKEGELSIVPLELILLSPCLNMLPKKKKNKVAFSDVESRYRQRYLDLIMNDSVRKTFLIRSQIVKSIRKFLDERDFVEVETPILNMIAGGATARPFETIANEMKLKLYMRIAPELYLKELIVGGLNRVYEIGRQFRNEGIDLTHNPEFTTCEFYMAYADYHDLMDMTELLISEMVKDITGSYKIEYHANGKDKPAKVIDFSRPWRRIKMIPALKEHPEVKLNPPAKLDTEETRLYLIELLKKLKIECKPPHTTTRLLDKLVSTYLESQCDNPTFICDHPEVMSPLAKYHRSEPELTERFELFINQFEVCNAYTELNNPHVQRERFEQQARDKEVLGDDEAQLVDNTFLNALEYGLPPTGGWGIGIDRLTMLLTNSQNIKEVILFPACKPDPEWEKQHILKHQVTPETVDNNNNTTAKDEEK